MDVREKLVELLGAVSCQGPGESLGSCPNRRYGQCGEVENLSYCVVQNTANHLIAHGVTVQEWSSVSEPPEENGYYLCYVLTSAVGGKVKYEQMPLYWEDDIWLYRHNSYRMCRNVTHWMPLPQPPKGE